MTKIRITLTALFGFGCKNQPNVVNRLSKFTMYEKRFRFFFLISEDWVEAEFKNKDFYSLDDGSKISSLEDYMIAYRNGNEAYSSREFEYYPDEVDGMDSTTSREIIFRKEQ